MSLHFKNTIEIWGLHSKMGYSFGTDFSDVNVHANSDKAIEIGALAYAQGSDVHFAPGQFNPDSQKGQELIGHELAHVVQQKEGRVSAKKQGAGMPINDDPGLEKEADEMGAKAAQGKMADVKGKGNGIQRKTTDNSTKGEIGLHNEQVSNEGGTVTVSGTTRDGQVVRPQHYSEAEYEQSEELIKQLEAEAPTHAFFEQVAHNIAYKEPGFNPHKDEDNNQIGILLKQFGYQLYEVKRGRLGFQYCYLVSKKAGQNDIIGFRGTADAASGFADLDPESVGYQQYLMNKDLIDSLLTNAEGKVDVTGHSLGGALAQLVTSYHASKVGNVYTFQSPGISSAMVENYNKTAKEDRPNVYHHVAVGDMVDKAGDANLPGTVYSHDFGYYWIETNELLNNVQSHWGALQANMEAVGQESKSLAGNFGTLLKETTIPLYQLFNGQNGMDGMVQDIQDIQGLIAEGKKDAAALKLQLGDVVGAVASAHKQFLFSSENFTEARTQNKMADGLYANGVDESSVVTAHDSYPYQEERKTTENVRDAAGEMAYQYLSPAQIMTMYQKVEALQATLDQMWEAVVAIGNFIADGASSVWESITSFPETVRQAMATFLYELDRYIKYQIGYPMF